MRILVKKSLSVTELAKTLKLSSTGVFTIVDEMIKEGILYKCESQVSAVGRKSLLLKISKSIGVVALVDFANLKQIYICSLDGEVLFCKNINIAENNTFDTASIREIIDSFALFLSNNYKLLNICIATPGIVDSISGKFIYSPSFDDYKALNLKELFERTYNVPVYIKNDLKFALLTEKNYGKYRNEIENTLMVQLGIGIGSALFLNGALHEGSRGRGSEIGMFELNIYQNSFSLIEEEKKFYSVTSYDRIIDYVISHLKKGDKSLLSNCDYDKITIHDIVAAYEKEDSLCEHILNSIVKMTADAIGSLNCVIDFQNLIILTKHYHFGQKYLNKLAELLNNKFDFGVSIFLSSIEHKDIVYKSLFDFACEKAIDNS